MKRTFLYKDGKSNKFWNIDYSEDNFAVNYGKLGTIGKYKLSECDSAEECTILAEKLITQKIKKGYYETDFDETSYMYFDDPEYGVHRKTSHPAYCQYFTDDIYYDIMDEEAPFGSDSGNDTLHCMEEILRKKTNFHFADMPEHIVKKIWGMEYIPAETLDESKVKYLLDNDKYSLTESDSVTIACAFGQIKIIGRIDEQLRKNAVNALKRTKIISKLEDYGHSDIQSQLIRDLEGF